MPATSFKELENEEIIDLKCGHFYSVVLTHSGKVFWWYVSLISYIFDFFIYFLLFSRTLERSYPELSNLHQAAL